MRRSKAPKAPKGGVIVLMTGKGRALGRRARKGARRVRQRVSSMGPAKKDAAALVLGAVVAEFGVDYLAGVVELELPADLPLVGGIVLDGADFAGLLSAAAAMKAKGLTRGQRMFLAGVSGRLVARSINKVMENNS